MTAVPRITAGNTASDFPEVEPIFQVLVEAEQDPAKANPLKYAIKARKFIAEKTGL